VALPRGAAIAFAVLRVLVALFFAYLGWKSLSGDPRTAADFRRFGYSDEFRMVVGAMQIAGAAALALPAVAFWGAALLAAVLCGAVYSHLRFDPPATLASPLVFLALIASLAIVYRPALLR
jgi:uncharacterized membrane protein YphA (DoxX/SURF4 family)